MSRKKQKSRPKRRRRPGAGTANPSPPASAGIGLQGGGRSGVATQEQIERRARMARPRPWSGEAVTDVAVFDVVRRRELPVELSEQAAAVAEALACVADHRDTEGLRLVESISRSSPFSNWRLFVRGLVDWYNDRFDEANRCWERLDPERRPARLARALESGRSANASSSRAPTPESTTGTPNSQENGPDLDAVSNTTTMDSDLQKAGRLVYEYRVARPALQEAARETSRFKRRSSQDDGEFGPDALNWLLRFRRAHRESEPHLVGALEQAAIALAFRQPYVDIFDRVAQAIEGPPHDPNHRLLASQYQGSFQDGRQESRSLRDRYLNKDLPRCAGIKEPVRNAIAGLLHLEHAQDLLDTKTPAPFLAFFGQFAPPVDEKAVTKSFAASLKAYPANEAAHRAFTTWLLERTEEDGLTKAEKAKLQQTLTSAMEGWAKAIPDTVDPRLWLVDHYLESDQIDSAQPHIDALRNARLEDPRVRALPWRCALLRSMKLARVKSRLAAAEESLREAEQLWPSWLSRDWLPFLRAALALRGGDRTRYEQLRGVAAANCPGATTGNTMMFAAASSMRVPAADIRPLRELVNDQAKKANEIPLEDLLGLGSFFWDLQRANLTYVGYVKHGSKFGRDLVRRLSQIGVSFAGQRLEPAVLWAAENRFWSTKYGNSAPLVVTQDRNRNNYFAAAVLRALLKTRWSLRYIAQFGRGIAMLREAALTEADAFYRHLFKKIADEAEAAIASSAYSWRSFQDETRGAPGGYRDSAATGDYDLDDDDFVFVDEDVLDDDESDDDLGYDPYCDCPVCTADRKAAERAAQRAARQAKRREREPEPVPHPRKQAQTTVPVPESPERQDHEPLFESVAENEDVRRVDESVGDVSRAEDLKRRRRRNPLDPQNRRRSKGRRG